MLVLDQKVLLTELCIMLWVLTEEEIYQPFIGVASTWNESAPCNITLQDQAQFMLKMV